MKKLMIFGWLILSGLTAAAAKRTDFDLVVVKDRFEKAYAEIKAMLNGRTAFDLRRAVFLQEWAYLDGRPKYEYFCAGIDACAAAIRRFMDANGLGSVPIGGNIALYNFFSHPYSMNGYKPYTYDFDDPEGSDDYTHIFVTKLMRTHKGQCRSLPLFYKMLANEIGAEAYIAYAPRHTFIRHRDPQDTCWINLELTNHTISRDFHIAQMTDAGGAR